VHERHVRSLLLRELEADLYDLLRRRRAISRYDDLLHGSSFGFASKLRPCCVAAIRESPRLRCGFLRICRGGRALPAVSGR
jgi:hypothetical protein